MEIPPALAAACRAAVNEALTYGGRSHAIAEVVDLVWRYAETLPEPLPKDQINALITAILSAEQLLGDQ